MPNDFHANTKSGKTAQPNNMDPHTQRSMTSDPFVQGLYQDGSGMTGSSIDPLLGRGSRQMGGFEQLITSVLPLMFPEMTDGYKLNLPSPVPGTGAMQQRMYNEQLAPMIQQSQMRDMYNVGVGGLGTVENIVRNSFGDEEEANKYRDIREKMEASREAGEDPMAGLSRQERDTIQMIGGVAMGNDVLRAVTLGLAPGEMAQGELEVFAGSRLRTAAARDSDMGGASPPDVQKLMEDTTKAVERWFEELEKGIGDSPELDKAVGIAKGKMVEVTAAYADKVGSIDVSMAESGVGALMRGIKDSFLVNDERAAEYTQMFMSGNGRQNEMLGQAFSDAASYAMMAGGADPRTYAKAAAGFSRMNAYMFGGVNQETGEVGAAPAQMLRTQMAEMYQLTQSGMSEDAARAAIASRSEQVLNSSSMQGAVIAASGFASGHMSEEQYAAFREAQSSGDMSRATNILRDYSQRRYGSADHVQQNMIGNEAEMYRQRRIVTEHIEAGNETIEEGIGDAFRDGVRAEDRAIAGDRLQASINQQMFAPLKALGLSTRDFRGDQGTHDKRLARALEDELRQQGDTVGADMVKASHENGTLRDFINTEGAVDRDVMRTASINADTAALTEMHERTGGRADAAQDVLSAMGVVKSLGGIDADTLSEAQRLASSGDMDALNTLVEGLDPGARKQLDAQLGRRAEQGIGREDSLDILSGRVKDPRNEERADRTAKRSKFMDALRREDKEAMAKMLEGPGAAELVELIGGSETAATLLGEDAVTDTQAAGDEMTKKREEAQRKKGYDPGEQLETEPERIFYRLTKGLEDGEGPGGLLLRSAGFVKDKLETMADADSTGLVGMGLKAVKDIPGVGEVWDALSGAAEPAVDAVKDKVKASEGETSVEGVIRVIVELAAEGQEVEQVTDESVKAELRVVGASASSGAGTSGSTSGGKK